MCLNCLNNSNKEKQMKNLILLTAILAILSLRTESFAQKGSSVLFDPVTGTLTDPLAAKFLSGNPSIGSVAAINSFAADPTSNGSFSLAAWRTDLVLPAFSSADPGAVNLFARWNDTTNQYEWVPPATFRTDVGLAIGTNVQAFDATLAAVAAYNTNGIVTQTAADTFTGRTITGTAEEVIVINGNGVAGNPVIELAHIGDKTLLSASGDPTVKWGEQTLVTGSEGDVSLDWSINSNVKIPSQGGTDPESIATIGTGDARWRAPWLIKTANHTAASWEKIQANTAAGVFTVTLPAAPTIGVQVEIQDAALSWSANPLTVARNGLLINGAANNYTANVDGGKLSCVYISVAYGWSIK